MLEIQKAPVEWGVIFPAILDGCDTTILLLASWISTAINSSWIPFEVVTWSLTTMVAKPWPVVAESKDLDP